MPEKLKEGTPVKVRGVFGIYYGDLVTEYENDLCIVRVSKNYSCKTLAIAGLRIVSFRTKNPYYTCICSKNIVVASDGQET